MNWIRSNPFLAGFVGVMVVASGALGFLLFSASGKYSQVSETYTTQAAELRRLENLAPYPEPANYQKVKDQKEAYVSQLNGVMESVAKMQLPVEPMSPEQFQDELKAAVTAVAARAQQTGTQLPEKFYMGFDSYQSLPPKPAAAPLLGRQLRAVELLMGIILDARASGITAISRAPLPAEESEPAENAATKGKKAEEKLVTAATLQLDFLVEQSQLRAILNALATERKQCFVVRSLRIANEQQKGPSRTAAPSTAPAPQPPADQTAALGAERTAPAGPALKFIVGDERILVSLKIDVMEFALPKSGKGK